MPNVAPVQRISETPPQSVIVIGTGLAGLRTVSALRATGFTGKITVFGTEAHLPYDRPPLSKKLLARTEPVFLHDDLGLVLHEFTSHVHAGYTVTGLNLATDGSGRTRATVTAEPLDPATGAATKHVTADFVVLATGSTPVVPAGWGGTHKLYTWDDAQQLRSALTRSERQDVVIIGAGWIGAELATVAGDAGHRVTVVEAQTTPLAVQLGPAIGTLTAAWYKKAGIELLTGTSVDRVKLSPDSKRHVHVTGADLPGGQVLIADIVITAIGARPATQWLPPSFPRSATGALRTDQWGRITVDEFPEAQIYAVGDCAERADAVFTTVPGGHWNTALQDPDRVAAAITETFGLPRAHAPQVFSTQLGHELNLFGLPNVATDQVLIRPSASPDGDDWVGLYVAPQDPGRVGKDSGDQSNSDIRTVTGIFTVDSPRIASQARKLMSNGPVQLDLAKALDPNVALRAAIL